MNARGTFRPISVGLLAGACQMPNPAFHLEDGGETADESASAGDSETTSATATDDTTADGTSTSTTGPTDTTTTDGTDTEPQTSSTETGGPEIVEYGAVVAECLDLEATLDPVKCEEYAGEATVTVDELSDFDQFIITCLAFEVGPEGVGKTILEARMILTATDVDWAAADASGEVWAVQPFTYQSLLMGPPPKKGVSALAADLGPVVPNQQMAWSLPPDSVVPDQPLFLCLYPTSMDGAHYWKKTGATPPVLELTIQ